MKKAEMKPFKEMLLGMRSRLRGNVFYFGGRRTGQSLAVSAEAVDRRSPAILPIWEATLTSKTTPFA